MKVLVTGKGGQLASEFEHIYGNNPNWTFVSIDEFDITNKKQILNHCTHQARIFTHKRQQREPLRRPQQT